MRWKLVCGLLITILVSNGHAQDLPVLAIEHVNVVDVISGEVLTDRTVIVRDTKIESIVDGANSQVPDNAVRIAAAGKFLIPGLWDMHIHWYDRNSMQLFPVNGVTGARVMSGMPLHHMWRKQFETGEFLGPHLLISSPIIDGPSPIWPGSFVAADEADGKQVVARAVELKADFLKVYSLLPRSAYLAIAAESKLAGIPFAGHVPLTVSMAEASNAGQVSMEHLYEILIACSSKEDELRSLRAEVLAKNGTTRAIYDDKELMVTIQQRALATYDEHKARVLFALLAQNKTWQCPTLTVLRNLAYLETTEVQQNPNLKYLTPALRSMIAPPKDKNGRTAAEFAQSQKMFEMNLGFLRAMQAAGVPILAGTDCLNPFCLPGFSLHDELQLLVRAGLKPIDALRAATINPAKFQNKEHDFGSVTEGKQADLVMLDANPLNDISNTRKIVAVILRGNLLDRQALDDKLNSFEQPSK